MQNIEMSFRKSNNVPRSKWPGKKKKKKLGMQGFNFSLITLEKTTLLQTRKVCTEEMHTVPT